LFLADILINDGCLLQNCKVFNGEVKRGNLINDKDVICNKLASNNGCELFFECDGITGKINIDSIRDFKIFQIEDSLNKYWIKEWIQSVGWDKILLV
jgi:hypothetical protein